MVGEMRCAHPRCKVEPTHRCTLCLGYACAKHAGEHFNAQALRESERRVGADQPPGQSVLSPVPAPRASQMVPRIVTTRHP